MKKHMFFGALCLLLMSVAAHADTLTLTTATPGEASTLPQTKPSVILGGTFINFDSLAPSSNPVSTLTTQGVTFSSPDTIQIIPYSTQSGPNELYDDGTSGTYDGAADLTIKLGSGTDGIGVGIADSDVDLDGDPVAVYLQALNASGGDLGSAFLVTIPENTANPGNGYFVISDSASNIYGLQITTATTNQSGLAIDDVQTAPEPSSFLLLATGLVMVGSFGMKKLKQA